MQRVIEKSVLSTSVSETKKLYSKNDKNNSQLIQFCQRKKHSTALLAQNILKTLTKCFWNVLEMF